MMRFACVVLVALLVGVNAAVSDEAKEALGAANSAKAKAAAAASAASESALQVEGEGQQQKPEVTTRTVVDTHIHGTGKLVGSLYGMVEGAVTGQVKGTVVGGVDGYLAGTLNGINAVMQTADSPGATNGKEVAGRVEGAAAGTVTGYINGLIAGTVEGEISGIATGIVEGVFDIPEDAVTASGNKPVFNAPGDSGNDDDGTKERLQRTQQLLENAVLWCEIWKSPCEQCSFSFRGVAVNPMPYVPVGVNPAAAGMSTYKLSFTDRVKTGKTGSYKTRCMDTREKEDGSAPGSRSAFSPIYTYKPGDESEALARPENVEVPWVIGHRVLTSKALLIEMAFESSTDPVKVEEQRQKAEEFEKQEAAPAHDEL